MDKKITDASPLFPDQGDFLSGVGQALLFSWAFAYILEFIGSALQEVSVR
ncbi:hypothetical protein HMPREF9374_2782 [Desmospora sp. 8437]|nr:hypothetical protein HMPREF9374_2782 [Desmospora sp. 8437]